VILEVTGLRVASGPMIRVDGLDLALPERGCIALLGPNGAGKTASVEAIAGLLPKAAGRVMFAGQDITKLDGNEVVCGGLEPSAGLAVGIVRAFIDALTRIRATGVAILLVEQNIEIATALADSCVVLAAGRVVWRGSTSDATKNEEIRQAYFM
jgi:ABC-type branched-subunit amino acid transport system ATPase component